ncbi:hypothetical protein BD309DRAFT_975644, partial [Dichomitus squalens]
MRSSPGRPCSDTPARPSFNVSEPYLPSGDSNATYDPYIQAILTPGVGHTIPPSSSTSSSSSWASH